jgi:hypothetical protein
MNQHIVIFLGIHHTRREVEQIAVCQPAADAGTAVVVRAILLSLLYSIHEA